MLPGGDVDNLRAGEDFVKCSQSRLCSVLTLTCWLSTMWVFTGLHFFTFSQGRGCADHFTDGGSQQKHCTDCPGQLTDRGVLPVVDSYSHLAASLPGPEMGQDLPGVWGWRSSCYPSESTS